MNWTIGKYTGLGAATVLAATLLAGPALADGMPSYGRAASGAPAARPCSTAGNVGLTTDYVFRGISQTNEEAAVQGGVDLTCGKFYLGAWGSSFYGDDGSTELDIYGGYRTTLGRFAVDLGFIYYAYPGSFDGDGNFLELKLGASTEVWKGGTVGGTVFYAPEGPFDQGSVVTLEGTIAQALPNVGMFKPTFSATLGDVNPDEGDGYVYWNAGLTLGFLEKWSLDLRYWDTDIDGGCFGTCDDRIVGTVKYTF